MADLEDDGIHWELDPEKKARIIRDGWEPAPPKPYQNGRAPDIHLPKQTGQSLPLLWFQDIIPALDTHDFVEDLIADGQLSVIYGESGCGKTFFALDMVLHIAQGKSWFGRDTKCLGIVYAAMEGGHGIKNRVSAFKTHYGLEDANLPFVVIPAGLDLLSEKGDTQRLVEAIRIAAGVAGIDVAMVVLDTLSRALSGGDENSSEDMGSIVRNADAIKAATGAHVMFIHHSGKDQARGARGHSLLRAATDTEIEVIRDRETGISTASVMKQRELETDGKFSFKLKSLIVGQNERGKDVRSCILEALDVPVQSKEKKTEKPLSAHAKLAYDVLCDLMVEYGKPSVLSDKVPTGRKVVRIPDWCLFVNKRTVSEATEASRQRAFKRASDAIQAKGLIGIWQDLVWLIEKR